MTTTPATARRLPAPPYRIEGERIVLREIRPEDADGPYVDWMNDPETVRYTESRHAQHSHDDIAAYIAAVTATGDNLFLAVLARDGGAHIGNIKIGPIDWRHRIGDLGLIIGDKSCWGRGYATEAIALITAFAFDSVGLHKVTASCYAPNKAAIRAFEKVGYAVEGVRRSHRLLEGRWTDLVMLGIVNPRDGGGDGRP